MFPKNMKFLISCALLGLSLSFTALAVPLSTLSSNKASYGAGEVAVLSAMLASKPDNASLEFDLEATLNSAPISVIRANVFSFSSTTSALPAGSYNWGVKVFLQDIRYAQSLKLAVQSFTNEIGAIDLALQTETNPTVIAQLQARKADLLRLRSSTLAQLAASRTLIESNSINFIVN